MKIIQWLGSALDLTLFYLKEVILSNLRVAYDVLTPTHKMNPAMITLDVHGLTDRQLFVAANLITMTPGTLSLDISENRKEMSIHGMYVDDTNRTLADLSQQYMRRVRNVF